MINIILKLVSVIQMLCTIVCIGADIYIVSVLCYFFKQNKGIKKEAFSDAMEDYASVLDEGDLIRDKNGVNNLIIFVLVFFVLTSSFFKSLLNIENIKFLNSGSYCYYVSINEINNGNLIPAQILKTTKEKSNVDYEYFLEKAEYPTGNIIKFDTSLSSSLTLGESVYVETKNGDYMWCRLINEPAKSEILKDSRKMSVDKVIFLLTVTLPIIAVLGVYNKKYREEN